MPPRPSVAALGSVFALAAAPLATAPAAAQDTLHQVRYVVTAEAPTGADIYYRDIDPPDFAAYSHNPYRYSPTADALLGPGQVWVRDVMIADPHQWAMVDATNGRGQATSNFHCTIEVGGVVVKTGQGPKGALCSLRPW